MSSFLTDGIVNLRPVERSDLAQLATWRNDPELRSRTREFRPLTLSDQERWFETISGPNRRDYMFVLEKEASDLNTNAYEQPVRVIHRPSAIGVVGLCYWNAHDRHAEISYYVGERELRGKGYTKRALELLITWGFDEGLARIYAECFSSNAPSLCLLKSLGFKHEGTMRSHVWRSGDFQDSEMLGLLRSEWTQRAEVA